MNCEWILEWTPFKYPWPSCQIFCHHPAPGGFHSVPAQLPADAKHLMFGNHKYTVVSRSNEECWKPSKPLSRFHTVCPSRKTRTRSSALQNSSLPAARSWVFDQWIKMWLPNAVHERESPEKENRLAWSSTVSLVSSHLRLKKYSFFSAWRDHLTICCMLKTKTEAALAFFT